MNHVEPKYMNYLCHFSLLIPSDIICNHCRQRGISVIQPQASHYDSQGALEILVHCYERRGFQWQPSSVD